MARKTTGVRGVTPPRKANGRFTKVGGARSGGGRSGSAGGARSSGARGGGRRR